MSGLTAILLALLMAGASQSVTPLQDPPPTAVEDVTVTGRSLPEAVNAFVDDVTEPASGYGPARWARRICVGVVNLRPEAAQVLIDRVSDVSASVGLEPGDVGCRPNILVIATDQASALADALIQAKPRVFRPNYSGAAGSPKDLEAFRTSTQPVRWWPISVPVDTNTGQVAVKLPGGDAPMISGGGRLTTNVASALQRVIVILDVTRMENITYQQLGDYLAMVSLAQIDDEADTSSFSTILNLFAAPSVDQTMTDWDRSYLASLYDSNLNQRNPGAQLGAVSSVMTRDRQVAQREMSLPQDGSR
ncbi:hypothetical protein BH09PSE1_BH09PSE1_20390 [soil metagenome]